MHEAHHHFNKVPRFFSFVFRCCCFFGTTYITNFWCVTYILWATAIQRSPLPHVALTLSFRLFIVVLFFNRSVGLFPLLPLSLSFCICVCATYFRFKFVFNVVLCINLYIVKPTHTCAFCFRMHFNLNFFSCAISLSPFLLL